MRQFPLLAIMCFILGSCSVQNRRYMDGYDIRWSSNHHSANDLPAQKKAAFCIADKPLLPNQTTQHRDISNVSNPTFSFPDACLDTVHGSAIPVDTLKRHRGKIKEDESLPLNKKAKRAKAMAWGSFWSFMSIVIVPAAIFSAGGVPTAIVGIFILVTFVALGLTLFILAFINAKKATAELNASPGKERGYNIARSVRRIVRFFTIATVVVSAFLLIFALFFLTLSV